MAYAPYFIADTVWMPPRTLISMFALIALPVFGAPCLEADIMPFLPLQCIRF